MNVLNMGAGILRSHKSEDYKSNVYFPFTKFNQCLSNLYVYFLTISWADYTILWWLQVLKINYLRMNWLSHSPSTSPEPSSCFIWDSKYFFRKFMVSFNLLFPFFLLKVGSSTLLNRNDKGRKHIFYPTDTCFILLSVYDTLAGTN